MKLFLSAVLLLVSFSTCFAYEKWEEIASGPEVVCYLDEESISQRNDNEYLFTLRFQYKKPKAITVTQTSYKNGATKKKNVKKMAKGVLNTVLLDVAKEKIYFQTNQFIVDGETINGEVSPDDVIESDNVIYRYALNLVNAKYHRQPEPKDDGSENALREGVEKFLQTSQSEGLIGVMTYTEECYAQSRANSDTNYFSRCAAVDVSAMFWNDFLVKNKGILGNNYFDLEKVRGRMTGVLKAYGTKTEDIDPVILAMMGAIKEKYQQALVDRNSQSAGAASDDEEGE